MTLKPDCPRCGSHKNVVDFATYWRCAFCGTKISKDIEQTKLNHWVQ